MDIEKTVMVRMKKTANLLDRFMNTVKSGIDKKVGEAKNVSAIQGRIILHLHDAEQGGEVLQKDIESRFEIRSSTATIILGRMEKNGLITREISAGDVRKKRKAVRLTRKARKLYAQTLEEIEDTERRITKGLSRGEIDTLFRILDKITENIS